MRSERLPECVQRLTEDHCGGRGVRLCLSAIEYITARLQLLCMWWKPSRMLHEARTVLAQVQVPVNEVPVLLPGTAACA